MISANIPLAKFVISCWAECNCGWVPDAASLCASKRCKSVCKTARLTKCTYYQLLPHSTFWIGLDSHRFGPDNWYTEMSSKVYTRNAVYCLQAIPIVRLLPKHRIKTDFVQSRKRHGKVAASPDDASWERSRKTLSHSSLNRLCLWSVQTCPWQSLWFPTEPSAIVAGYQMLPHFAQAKDARAFARLQDLQSIPTTSYYHTVLVELDWTAIGLALTTGILRWVAKSIQDMLSTVYRLYPLSHFCQKIGLKLTSVQSRNGTRRLLHLLIMPREKEVEKLLLLLLQSHSSLNRLCLWSAQTYPWQSLWFPAERSAIVAGYQILPHFAQAKDARASARLQDLQSIPTTSYYHTVLVELDWTAIGLALTTGILKWVAQSVQDMLSTVDRLYPFVRLLPKDRIKTDFVQSRNGTGRLLHLLIMPREKEVEKLLLLLLQSHSSLNRLCLWSVQTYPWQSLWFPAERSAIVAGYQVLPHFA